MANVRTSGLGAYISDSLRLARSKTPGAWLSIPRGRDRDGFAFSRGGADVVGYPPMRRRQRRMKANPSGPEGLALQGASAVLRGLAVESTTAGAARLASAPLQRQRGSRGILRQAPRSFLGTWAWDPTSLPPAAPPISSSRRSPRFQAQKAPRPGQDRPPPPRSTTAGSTAFASCPAARF